MRILSFILLFTFLTASALNDARKANAAFERGDYAEAVQLYRQAIEQDPDNARLHFNLGNALSRMGQREEAADAYSRFNELTESPLEQSLSHYNMGRMLTEDENYEEALNFFREALIKNPDDEDARHNFELAVKRQQQHEQEQPEDDSGSDGGDDEEQQQDQQDDQQQDPQMDQQPESQQDQSGDGEQEQRPLDMTPEEAENILDALEQLERELLENRKKESSRPPSRNERDW
ncbi:MAG: tetratricopeptide repeat protein [Balneolaceae bacterium]|nr:MAG: tetratricopeptide repeat protein [Balneolaceae bacterium]